MIKKQLLILLMTCWIQQHSAIPFAALSYLLSESWKVIKVLNDVKSTFDTGVALASIFTSSPGETAIPNAIIDIDDKLEDIEALLRYGQNYLESLVEQVPNVVAENAQREQIVRFITGTTALWNEFTACAKEGCHNHTIADLIETIKKSIERELPYFRTALAPSSDIAHLTDGLFVKMMKNADARRDDLCDIGQTSHYNAIRILHSVLLTEIKAHILVCFAKLDDDARTDGAWRRYANGQFRKQFNRYLKVIMAAFATIPIPYIRSCDPEERHRGDAGFEDNFYEFEGFIQLAVLAQTTVIKYCRPIPKDGLQLVCDNLNEWGMQDRNDGSECGLYGINHHNDCANRVENCTAIEDERELTQICPWADGPYRIRYMRHGGVTVKSDTVRDNPCTTEVLGFDHGYVSNSVKGAACSCTCLEDRLKVMTVMALSNIHDNCIVVGLRVHKIKDYIYIQIAEAKLDEHGAVRNASWVPVGRDLGLNWGWSNDGALIVRDHPYFFLEDHQLIPGQVLIGAQFTKLLRKGQIGFGIAILGMTINYSTGQLRLNERSFGQRSHPDLQLKELKIRGKNPIFQESTTQSRPASYRFTHVGLRQSELTEDFGQSTLPLVDGVPIVTNPLAPIGGVGLIHKSTANYAGFLSLRLFPMNYTDYLEYFRNAYNLDELWKFYP